MIVGCLAVLGCALLASNRRIICRVKTLLFNDHLAAPVGLLARVYPFAVNVDRLGQVVDLCAEIFVADGADHSAYVSVAVQFDLATVLVVAKAAAEWTKIEAED